MVFWCIVIFLGAILLYLVVYCLLLRSNGGSIVITRLIHREETNKKTLAPPVTPGNRRKNAILIAKESKSTAEKALKKAEDANTITQNFIKGKKKWFWIYYGKKDNPFRTSRNLTKKVDSFYYLPTASLSIVATAKVITSLNTDNVVVSAALSELQLQTTVITEADTNQLLGINYNSFVFANDEVRLTTDSEGLLETVSATAEDRISNIIADISQAPKYILDGQTPKLAFASLDMITPNPVALTKTNIYTNTFAVLADELLNSPLERTWIINVDGANTALTVDASFQCTFSPRTYKDLPEDEEIKGLLTRPLCKIKLDLYSKDNSNSGAYTAKPVSTFAITVPDTSIFIEVPILRAAFVKKITLPKFSKGSLIENYINKPSQVEAALSIPINVLKTIVSIPAQLLSFKIVHVQQETALATAQQAYEKTQVSSQSHLNAAVTTANQLKQTSLDTKQNLLNSQNDLQDLAQQISTMKGNLGTPALNTDDQNRVQAAVTATIGDNMTTISAMSGYLGYDFLTDAAGNLSLVFQFKGNNPDDSGAQALKSMFSNVQIIIQLYTNPPVLL